MGRGVAEAAAAEEAVDVAEEVEEVVNETKEDFDEIGFTTSRLSPAMTVIACRSANTQSCIMTLSVI